ncbi:MAG: hypothetical protein KBD53_11970 [Candidatus Omnitrophica bacterium]|nr:hypothetical protein [Candidatus Omnitrophota bacterium]
MDAICSIRYGSVLIFFQINRQL